MVYVPLTTQNRGSRYEIELRQSEVLFSPFFLRVEIVGDREHHFLVDSSQVKIDAGTEK